MDRSIPLLLFKKKMGMPSFSILVERDVLREKREITYISFFDFFACMHISAHITSAPAKSKLGITCNILVTKSLFLI